MIRGRESRICVVVAGVSLLIVSLGGCSVSPQSKESWSLREALDNQFAQAVLCGIGVSSGLAVVMAVKSAVGSRLKMTVESGTVLRSGDSKAQDMIVRRVEGEHDLETTQDIAKECVDAAQREEERRARDPFEWWRRANSIALQPYETHLFLMSAYCLDFEKDNPGTTTQFSVSAGANQETQQLYEFLGRQKDDPNPAGVQLATWSTNGDLSAAEIAKKFEFDQDELTEACQLLGQAGIDAGTKRLCQQ